MACIDEISTLATILDRNRKMLDTLKDIAKLSDEQDSSGDSEGEKASDRVNWACEIVRSEAGKTHELLADLQKSRDAVSFAKLSTL